MDLFLNYNESFLKVKARYLEIKEKNDEWYEANVKCLEDIANNSSGKWSEEYQKQAAETLADIKLLITRVDRMCEIFEMAEPDIIAMLNRCAMFSILLNTDAFDVSERECDTSPFPVALNDLMYDSSYKETIITGCDNVSTKNDDEVTRVGKIKDLVLGLNKVPKTFLDGEISEAEAGIAQQQRIDKFEDNFIRYANEVSEFNTSLSTAFADVVGEYYDFPAFYRTTDYDVYLDKNYPQIRTLSTDDYNKMFDDDGMYGGNQSDIFFNHLFDQEFIEWAKQYPGFEDKSYLEMLMYFSSMDINGCGYIAVVNSILLAYTDCPEKFQEEFGFPLYDENGEFNFDKLFFVYFSETADTVYTDCAYGYEDYHRGMITYYKSHPGEFKEKYGVDLYIKDENGEKVINPKANEALQKEYNEAAAKGENIKVPITGNGREGQINKTQHFMEEHGGELSGYEYCEGSSMSPETYDDYVSQGYTVIIEAVDFKMTNLDGTPANFGFNVGPHSMVVTDVLPDGRYVVSSWGKEYIIDVSDADWSYLVAVKIDPDAPEDGG